jgi:ABC-type methionine transport system ATPase subunit
MTALENVMIGRHCRTKSNAWGASFRTRSFKREEYESQRYAEECLEFCGLLHLANEISSSLPYGAQRRLEIARALATEPKLICLDEPAAGMNTTDTQQLNELDQEFNRVASMMSGQHQALQGDISNGASILSTLAQHQAGLQQELQHASSSLGQVNSSLAGRQQDVHQLLAQMPALLRVEKQLASSSTTAAATINPCMQTLLTTIKYLALADNYKQAPGSTDGVGYMLRVDPQLAGPDTGSLSPPTAACAGGGG